MESSVESGQVRLGAATECCTVNGTPLGVSDADRMATKLKAARIITEAGGDMIIANGEDPEALYDIVGGKPVGTRFVGRKAK